MEDQLQTTGQPPELPRKQLVRSSDNRMLLGVCGGLGAYFDVDPTLVRVIFAVGLLVAGSTALVYVVLAIVMPAPAMAEAHPREAARGTLDEAVSEIRSAVNWVVDRLPFGKKKSE
jgi:phage shock protein PspC (stress-responsive transcriptional regulator)